MPWGIPCPSKLMGMCMAGLETQNHDRQHGNLELCLLWAFGNINADIYACRLQSPYSKLHTVKLGPLGISIHLALLFPYTQSTQGIPLHLQSFPCHRKETFRKVFNLILLLLKLPELSAFRNSNLWTCTVFFMVICKVGENYLC